MPQPRHPWEAAYPPSVTPRPAIERRTLGSVFRDAVARFVGRPAVAYRDTVIDYRELGRQAARVANALKRDGIGRGSPVALYLPNCAFHPPVLFGALLTGARVTHLSPLDAVREIAHKCRDSGARLLITLNLAPMLAMAERLIAAGAIDRVVVCDDRIHGPSDLDIAEPTHPQMQWLDNFLADAPDTMPPDAATADDIAFLQYTGGTTGLPKGTILTHANLTAATQIYDAWYAQKPPPPAGDVALCVLPVFHMFALGVVIIRQIKEGSLIVMRHRFDPVQTVDDIERWRVTIFAGVPTMWFAVLNQPDIAARDLSSLRICATGGAPMPADVQRRFMDLTGLPLMGGWGMTETSPAGTIIPFDGAPDKPGTIGIPMPGLEMSVVSLEDSSAHLPYGETGEIVIRGPNVTWGYWNREDATRAAFADGWFLTGDVGYMDADGFLFLVDRKSDMIISSGYNVYPQTVESAVYRHPDVLEAIAVGVPDAYRGEATKVFVTLRPGRPAFSLEDLRAFLADSLGRHELPTALEFRDTLPRTAVGKLSRRSLRDEERAKAADG